MTALDEIADYKLIAMVIDISIAMLTSTRVALLKHSGGFK